MANDFGLSRYAVGGATRPDSFTSMRPEFGSALAAMFAAAPPEIQAATQISSGFRSPELQAKLYEDAIRKYGSPEKARKWVAPPGRSNHGHGGASDLKYGNDAARQWWHANAAQHGLAFPLGHEDWHIELAGQRGGHAHPAPQSAPAAPAALGDVMAAQQAPAAAAPDLGALMAGKLQSIQARREADSAEKQRRAALFDAGSIAALYG